MRERRRLGKLPPRLCQGQQLAGLPDATPAQLRARGIELIGESLGDDLTVQQSMAFFRAGQALLSIGSRELQAERQLIGDAGSQLEDALYEMSGEEFESVVTAVQSKRTTAPAA